MRMTCALKALSGSVAHSKYRRWHVAFPARVLFSRTDFERLQFITVEQLALPVTRSGAWIVMEFPVYDTEPIAVPRGMLDALGLESVIESAYSAQNKIILLQFQDAAVLAALRPDFRALVASYDGINGVVVTAAATDGTYDFHYRYFWPWAGTDEDPVTGGVQTFLAKYWGQRLFKTHLHAFQSSARTGWMSLELREDRVLLCSDAVIVLEGSLADNVTRTR